MKAAAIPVMLVAAMLAWSIMHRLPIENRLAFFELAKAQVFVKHLKDHR